MDTGWVKSVIQENGVNALEVCSFSKPVTSENDLVLDLGTVKP